MDIGMIVVAILEGTIHGDTTHLGKLWVSSMMVLFALELLRLFESVPWRARVTIQYAEYLAGIIVIVSIADKIRFLRSRLKNPYKGHKEAPGE